VFSLLLSIPFRFRVTLPWILLVRATAEAKNHSSAHLYPLQGMGLASLDFSLPMANNPQGLYQIAPFFQEVNN
jgi:hypothetical protein